jgi:hypothetical protein
VGCKVINEGNLLKRHGNLLKVLQIRPSIENGSRIGEISGSHGGKYEVDCLLGCCAV